MIEIRYAEKDDRDFWYGLDRHLPESEYDRKVRDRHGYVISSDGVPVGLLRYNLFWDNTPFCTMLFIDPAAQRKGFGSALLKHWEKDMTDRGFAVVMTSTRADEDAQHFYRKLGYRDCGGMVIDIAGHEQPTELFLIKKLGE